jgi:hypothetical protein
MKWFIYSVNTCNLLLKQPAILCNLREKWMLSVTVIVAMFTLQTSSLISVGGFCLLSFKRHVDAFYPIYVYLIRQLMKHWLGWSQKCLPSWIGLSRYRRYNKHQNSRSSAWSLWVPRIMKSVSVSYHEVCECLVSCRLITWLLIVFLSINQQHTALDFWILNLHLTTC